MNHYELIEIVKRVAANNNVTMVLDTTNEFFPVLLWVSPTSTRVYSKLWTNSIFEVSYEKS